MKIQSIGALLLLLLPHTSQAASSGFAFDTEPAPTTVKPPVAQTSQCTENYLKAAELFKAGKEIDLGRIPEFEAQFSGVTSTNRFVSRRSAIYLKMNINDQLLIEVPLTVCLTETASGKVLIAKIITSKAVDPGTTQPNAMVVSALQDPAKGIPPRITVKIARTGRQVNFAGTEVDFEATATLK